MHPINFSTQRGASLFISLILMTALTLVSLGSLSTSLMELRMSNNTESGMSAFQQAQAGIDATLAKPEDYYIVNGNVGDTRCYNFSGCASSIAAMPEPIASSGSAQSVRITRVTSEACPPRTRDAATSCVKLRATSFVGESAYNNTYAGQGQAELAQGYIRLMPAGDNRDTGTSTSDTKN
jgi:Tfp pilus assembly protein PilX